MVAAIFHVAGSLLVVFNSFRLMRLGEELESHEGYSSSPFREDSRLSHAET